MRRFLTATAVVTLLSVPACSSSKGSDAPLQTPPAPTAVATSASSPAVQDEQARLACRLTGDAIRGGSVDELTDTLTIQAVTRAAAASSLSDVQLAGTAVERAYAKTLSDEAGADGELMDAARGLISACADAGIDGS